jgi:hypothetical protein
MIRNPRDFDTAAEWDDYLDRLDDEDDAEAQAADDAWTEGEG